MATQRDWFSRQLHCHYPNTSKNLMSNARFNWSILFSMIAALWEFWRADSRPEFRLQECLTIPGRLPVVDLRFRGNSQGPSLPTGEMSCSDSEGATYTPFPRLEGDNRSHDLEPSTFVPSPTAMSVSCRSCTCEQNSGRRQKVGLGKLIPRQVWPGPIKAHQTSGGYNNEAPAGDPAGQQYWRRWPYPAKMT